MLYKKKTYMHVLTSQKLGMFILTVAAQCSCNDAYLLPNNGLIWKIYKPKMMHKC